MLGRGRSPLSRVAWLGVLCLVLVVPAQANFAFYTIVQQVCRSYRVPVTTEQMHFEGADTGEPSFTITLQSRRNNFEHVMLVGYIAAAQARARTETVLNSFRVVVIMPSANGMTLMTKADAELVERLRTGVIKSTEFMKKLEWI